MEIQCQLGRAGMGDAGDNDNSHRIGIPDIHNCSILIIDDEHIIIQLISAVLADAGFTNLRSAKDGDSGLRQIFEMHPDLVILDLKMPVMDGLTVLKIVRAEPKFDDIPIIVETAENTLEARNEVLRAGATNIISKPLDSALLLDRVNNHLEHRLLVASLKSYQRRVQQELDAARGMQVQLLPRTEDIEMICDSYGVNIDWHYQPSSELGGDWWGILPVNENCFSVFAVDFSGHGVGAAINTFRLHTIMADVQPLAGNPPQFLSVLNDMLKDLVPIGQFATMLHATVDLAAGTLTYASAGHTAPVTGNRGMGAISALDPSGLPLGIKKGVDYNKHEIPFGPGDFLMLYSDALTETPGPEAPALEDEGLQDWVKEALSLSADAVPLQWLLDRFYAHAVDPPSDDVTALWIERRT